MILAIVVFICGIWISHSKPMDDDGKDQQRLSDETLTEWATSVPSPAWWQRDRIDHRIFRVMGKTYHHFHHDNWGKTWAKARDKCQSLGGDLASMPTKEEYYKVMEKFERKRKYRTLHISRWSAHKIGQDRRRRVKDGYWDSSYEYDISGWVGLTMDGDDYKNDWKWLTGEPISYDDDRWYTCDRCYDAENKRQPEKDPNVKCGRVWYGTLQSRRCDRELLRYLCEV